MWIYLAALAIQGVVMGALCPYHALGVFHGFCAGVLAMSAGVNYKRERDAKQGAK